MHEASLHDSNQFLTLTYDEEHYPHDQSLSVHELQKFFKRARKPGRKFRYFACGEYGDRSGRAHYHALIFGCAFSDDELRGLWRFGFTYTGAVTFESASYVARYCTKKALPKLEGLDHYLERYERVDRESGEVFLVHPEFMLCSRRPAVGRVWIDKFLLDCYGDDRDSVVVRGVEAKTPRYYDKVLGFSGSEILASKKESRVRAANLSTLPGSLSPRRLEAKRSNRAARLALSKGKL
jgi:hypothetical protein